MKALQRAIVKWATGRFPSATDRSSFLHLKREVKELAKAIRAGDRDMIAEESADIALLLIHINGRFHKVDLLDAIRTKFEINKKRQWGEPDADGVVEHIRN